MSDTPRTADHFVRGESEIPHPVQGAVPVYDDGIPPRTVLPAWRCPCCGESAPTIYDVWQARRNADRCAELRREHEFDTDEWEAYNEGVRHYNGEMSRLLGCLPAQVSSWVSKATNPRHQPDPFGVNDR